MLQTSNLAVLLLVLTKCQVLNLRVGRSHGQLLQRAHWQWKKGTRNNLLYFPVAVHCGFSFVSVDKWKLLRHGMIPGVNPENILANFCVLCLDLDPQLTVYYGLTSSQFKVGIYWILCQLLAEPKLHPSIFLWSVTSWLLKDKRNH